MVEDFISGINNRSAKAWESLYHHYYAALCSYVDHMIKDSHATEDLVQDVFIAIWRSERMFVSMKELTNYLYRACYNNSLVYIRNNKIHNTILDRIGENAEFTEDDAYSLMVVEEVVRQLYHLIDSLPQEQKNVILLSLKEYSIKEIAEKLSISVNTVKTHKSRAMRFLRSKFQDSIYFFLL